MTVHNPKGFDQIAVEYDFMATLFNDNSFFSANLSKNRTKALDIGCGTGILAFELAKYYTKVVGIDISQDMLAIAQYKRAAPNIAYLQMDANELYLKEKFDLVTSRTTFHHLHDISHTLEQIKQLLNTHGKLVVVDITSETGRLTPTTFVIRALRNFIPTWVKYGPGAAIRFFKFNVSKEWLAHVESDRFLSEREFKERYGHSLPNCSFEKIDLFMRAVWENNMSQ